MVTSSVSDSVSGEQKPGKSRGSDFWVKTTLIAIALLYLGLVLFFPVANVVYLAFEKGIEPFFRALTVADFIGAVQLTLLIAGITLPLNTVFGLCAAWVIARNQFWGRTLLISIIDLPFSISPVVVGLMLILLYGKNGWLGSFLEQINLKLIFATPGIVIATAIVTMPFVAREVIPVLEEIGNSEEEAARILGASDWQIFWRITIPNIRWGLLYGLLLTNARAMGEFGAVSVVSGNLAGLTQTLPLYVEEAYKNYQSQEAFAASLILGLLALVTLVLKEILERRTGRRE